MATIAKKTAPNHSTPVNVPQFLGTAGENLALYAPCYIAADGLVYMSNGTAANAAAVVHGFNVRDARDGQPVTLFRDGLVLNYADALTPGQPVYLGAGAGLIADAATTGGTKVIGFALDASHIYVGAPLN